MATSYEGGIIELRWILTTCEQKNGRGKQITIILECILFTNDAHAFQFFFFKIMK